MKDFIRLDKYLAEMGEGTRSEIKEMARKGRIAVNGSVEKKTDRKVCPSEDTVTAVSYTPLDVYKRQMLDPENEQVYISDVMSYNHYFGWYGGKLDGTAKWMDAFHAKHPNRPIGISEYGAESNITYHSDDPKCKDYSEEYQAVYHEHLVQTIEERPYIWATYVWNMFDFGCDAREEGGISGRNNKGLVTMDRQIRKDAFYVYKAFWRDEPFVHICGRRYAQRVGAPINIKVYSNLPKVTLYILSLIHI